MIDHTLIVLIMIYATLGSYTQCSGQLRLLRTMPLRISTLTHWLVFWPLGLAMMLGLLAQGASLLLDGTLIHWQLLCQVMFSASILTFALPLTLRFGSQTWTGLPVMMVALIPSYGP